MSIYPYIKLLYKIKIHSNFKFPHKLEIYKNFINKLLITKIKSSLKYNNLISLKIINNNQL